MLKKSTVKVITKLGLTELSTDEVVKITEDLANFSYDNPDLLLPMFSYYKYYNNKQGVHYEQQNWEDLTFYKDIDLSSTGEMKEKFYNVTYPFLILDKSNMLVWSFTALVEQGKLKKDRIGGIIYTNAFSCAEGLYITLYLENKESVFVTISDEFTCKLENGIGASLSEFDLERLSKLELKSIKVSDESKSVVIPVNNPYMKKYFISLVNNFNESVIK